MARQAEIALEVELASAEVVDGLASGTVDCGLDVVTLVHDLHASTATTKGGLDRNRPAVLVGELVDLGALGDRCGVAGDATHTNVLGGSSGRELVAHDLDGRGLWPDEHDTHVGDCSGEIGVLAEEPVARMEPIGACIAKHLQDGFGVQVALGSGLASERVRLVGEPHMKGVAVEIAVNSNGGDAEVTTCPDDPNSDFTTVCDKDLFQHG